MRGGWECMDWSSRGNGRLQEMAAWLHGLYMALSSIYWWPVTDLSLPICMELHSYVHACKGFTAFSELDGLLLEPWSTYNGCIRAISESISHTRVSFMDYLRIPVPAS
ncbi:hypothetical protein VNO77_03113 [Canavalia gladiata]|uniref:Uncharacterized protein n=1 Tax=Canavalia gladiata TaxID=3824 RepID=A0AAN9R6I9_CANGL